MRAKTINEIQKFERGQDPKASMDIGGVIFQEIYDKMSIDLEIKKAKVINKAIKDWTKFVQQTLVGKTITAKMQKLAKIDTKNNNRMIGKTTTDTFTILVMEVIIDKAVFDKDFRNTSIIIAGDDNEIYVLRNLDDKITIHQ